MRTRSYTPAFSGTFLLTLLATSGQLASQTNPALSTIYTFTSAPSDGNRPIALTAASNGVLYGVSQFGGTGICTASGNPPGCGTVFSLTPPASPGGAWAETVLYNFAGGSDGIYPQGLVLGSGGSLYGTTAFGGSGACTWTNLLSGCGTVFELQPPAAGGVWTEKVLHSFTGGQDGSQPATGVVVAAGPNGQTVLYGSTLYGGPSICGPSGSRASDSGCGTAFSLTGPSPSTGKWSESVIYSFAGGRGGGNPSGLAIGAGPNGQTVLYGVAGSAWVGVAVFALTPTTGVAGAWTESVIYNRNSYINGGVTVGSTSNGQAVLYLTTTEHGGSVISLTPPAAGVSASGSWDASLLYTFNFLDNDGNDPAPLLTIGSEGVLYGTTRNGGALYAGTIFSLTPPSGGPGTGGAWTERVIYSFTEPLDGYLWPIASLAISPDGALYGAVGAAGFAGAGEVYSLAPPSLSGGEWTESKIYDFTGGNPGNGILSGLSIRADPNGQPILYGATEGGGAGSCAAGCGTVYALSPSTDGSSESRVWTASVLYAFKGGNDGAYPVAPVTVGSGGILYGTAQYGGSGPCTVAAAPAGCGVVFSLTPPASAGGAWTETTLHSFNIPGTDCEPDFYCGDNTDGAIPATAVTIGAGPNGQIALYGTTELGGNLGSGAAYSLTAPASPGGDWTETVLYNFYGRIGSYTAAAGASILALGAGGILYGTFAGGDGCPFHCRAAFSLSPVPSGSDGAWTETELERFDALEGASAPSTGVTIGAAPNGQIALYGTLPGEPYSYPNFVDQVYLLLPPSTPGGDWTESVLYSFSGPLDGTNPSRLVFGPGGVLYGTTQYGGSGPCTVVLNTGCGTVFALIPPKTPAGEWAKATLYEFKGGSDGAYPTGGVVIGSDGTLYGTTQPTVSTGTVFALNVGAAVPTPSINTGGVVNAASYSAPVVPGSIASAFGDFLLSAPLGATQLPLSGDLSGLSLTFVDGTTAPLFYVSGGQVNFQVPWELSNQSQATLAATLNTAGTGQTVNLAPVAPAIFSTNSMGSGQGAILDTSYRLVDASNPTTAGNYVVIFCTGLGAVTNQPATGSPALSYPLSKSATPTVTIGGVQADVQFSGLAPGFVGLYQVNALVPVDSGTGSAVSVTISMGGVTSNSVTIAVH